MNKSKANFSDILKRLEENKKKKLAIKIPEWSDREGITLPDTLPLEQCSSSWTADCKAALLRRALPNHTRLVDLTGGFGVDSWAFSKVFDNVLYFEMNPDLFKVSVNNFATLQSNNIKAINATVDANLIDGLQHVDCIYADPARRNEDGHKVFLIEDCKPDILGLIESIEKVSDYLLVKFSPMADLSMLKNRLSKACTNFSVLSMGIIGIKHEVKEILVLMGEKSVILPELFIADASLNSEDIVEVIHCEHSVCRCLKEKKYLIEPDALLMKTRCFDMICKSSIGAQRVGVNTILYVSDNPIDNALSPYCKSFLIKDIFKWNKQSIKEIGKRFPRAEVSVKGLPISSEVLAEKIGCKSGVADDGCHYHIFACETIEGKAIIVGQHL